MTMKYLLFWLVIINIITFAVFGIDKKKAIDGKFRVSEAALFALSLLGGSLGGFGEQAIQNNVDALICGEAGYHICQDLETRGLAVVLLGHDRSERPFVEILAKAAHEAGVPSALIDTMGDSHLWWTVTKGDCS